MMHISNDTNRKLKILVIEDSDAVNERYRIWLERVASLFPATNLEDAQKMLDMAVKSKERGMPCYDFVIITACIPQRVGDPAVSIPSTVPLVVKYRQNLSTVPFIATSCVSKFRDRLVEAGCGYATTKKELPVFILGLIA